MDDGANNRMVGGTHYKNEGIPDHWDIAYELKWCYLVGCATKYLWRLGRKGDESKKLEDVEKAIHYLQKKAEQLKEELGLAPSRWPFEVGKRPLPRMYPLDEVEGDASPRYVDQD